MVITVRLPLRSSTTCEALLVSLAVPPATKKPQNARACVAAPSTRASAPPATHRLRQDMVTPPSRSSPRDNAAEPEKIRRAATVTRPLHPSLRAYPVACWIEPFAHQAQVIGNNRFRRLARRVQNRRSPLGRRTSPHVAYRSDRALHQS